MNKFNTLVESLLLDMTDGDPHGLSDLADDKKLVEYLYSIDKLTKAEKKRKDSIFSRYDKYYNDGKYVPVFDTTGRPFSKFDPPEQREYALDRSLADFIKTISAKYKKKIDLEDFTKWKES